MCECVADAECRETLQGISHFLLPALLHLVWFCAIVKAPSLLRMSNHPPSQRARERLRSRYRSTSLCYHRYKGRLKWKRKRSFCKLGSRLTMRGDQRLLLLKDGNTPWASFGVIWFSMFKLLCTFEFFLKRLSAFCPYGSGIIACAAGVAQATRVKFDSDS
jgi:hypothetical protein